MKLEIGEKITVIGDWKPVVSKKDMYPKGTIFEIVSIDRSMGAPTIRLKAYKPGQVQSFYDVTMYLWNINSGLIYQFLCKEKKT